MKCSMLSAGRPPASARRPPGSCSLAGFHAKEGAAAASGREAAELANRRDFDVVLSDLGLPDIPGDVLIRQILAGARRRTRVVVVTGYGEPYLSRARQAGAEVVFTKPVEWARILEWLQRPDLAASA